MMAPVDGSGSWPAWMQTVEKRAVSGSFTGSTVSVRRRQEEAPAAAASDPSTRCARSSSLDFARDDPERAQRVEGSLAAAAGASSCLRRTDTVEPVKLPDTARFSTICIHAGPGARPDDRRHHHADLPDVHLRAGRGRAAQGLRVRPHAEPDAVRARTEHRGHRRRQGGVRLRVRHGRDRRHHDDAQGGRPRRRDRQHLRRDVPALRAGAAAVRAVVQLRRHLAAGR